MSGEMPSILVSFFLKGLHDPISRIEKEHDNYQLTKPRVNPNTQAIKKTRRLISAAQHFCNTMTQKNQKDKKTLDRVSLLLVQITGIQSRPVNAQSNETQTEYGQKKQKHE